jgi:Arc/MetJ-type ribon-helix-helix transcriptional regulator
MAIAFTPEQPRWLEQAVDEGRFASVEDAVRVAVVTLMTEFDDTGDEDGDDSWLKPSLDAAREAVERGEGMTLDAYRAHLARQRAKAG